MVETSIHCDNCRKESPLEKHNGISTYRVPENWISVKPNVTRGRYTEDSFLKQMTVSELNVKLATMIPVVHICEDCLVDKQMLTKRVRDKEAAKLKRKLDKEQKVLEKQNRAIVEVTRVTSGRKLMIESEVRHGD